jgi:putative DNA primase/helicase
VSAPAAARGFASKITNWSGARKIEPDELRDLGERLSVPGPDDPSWDKSVGTKTHRQAASSPGAVIEDDLLVRAMRALDLVLGQPRVSPMGLGVDVRCPWGHEHTNRGDTGAFYAPGRGFRCHHGHCYGRGIPELLRRVDEMLREDSGGLVCLASLAFDDVDSTQVAVVPISPAKPLLRVQADGTFDVTEPGVAAAFGDSLGGHGQFDWATKVWLFWSPRQRCWEEDKIRRSLTLVDRFLKRVRLSLAEEPKLARKFDRITHVEAIERAVRSDPRVATHTATLWDQDPFILHARGVRVDQRTGAKRPAEPGDKLLLSTSVQPADIPTPVWDRFLWDTFDGDIDVIEFIPVLFGLFLTGDMSLEMFVFMHGPGGNGKGTLRRALSEIAGAYAKPIDDMFVQQAFDRDRKDGTISGLRGVRMGFSSEVEKGETFNWRRLKELTGNEGNTQARGLYVSNITFPLQTKFIISGNEKPAITQVNNAIARRLLLMMFRFTPVVDDKTLKQRLTAEYPGILWQLIEGGRRALAAMVPGGTGFMPLVPQSMLDAAQGYLSDEDPLLRWLTERCVGDAAASVQITQAYNDYKTWCAAITAEGEDAGPVIGPRKFSGEVKRAAVVAKLLVSVEKTMHFNVLRGLRLKP